MKKLALALVCLVSVAFFASCDKTVENPEPKITVIAEDGFITGTVETPQTIGLYDTVDYRYGFIVESNPETNKELASLKVDYKYVADQEYTYDTTIDLTGKTSFRFEEPVFEERMIILEYTITATVTDVDGQVNTATIYFKLDQPALDLEVMPLLWKREGGKPGEGLAEFGLKWTKNVKNDVFAVIEPINENVILYSIPAEKWAEVVTDFDKAALFSDSNKLEIIPDYRNVSAYAGHTFDDVIATLYEGEYYLMHITKSTVSTKGTTIVIEGEWK